MGRIVPFVAGFLALTSPALAQPFSGSPELVSKHLVDIGGGRHVNMVCIGSGSPTVVFEYGLGSHLLHWQKIQEPVSALTRSCFYDRAGYGYSDPSPKPMTAENVTDDLHALLDHAGISEPVVLVGHSLGGWYATLYTDRFPAKVVGLVLIDPSFAEMDTHESEGERTRDIEATEKSIASMRTCASLARAGKLTQSDPHDCFQLAPGRTPAEITFLMDQFLKPYRYEAVASEFIASHPTTKEGMDEFVAKAKAAERSWGDKPVIVLTAGVVSPTPGNTDNENKADAESWKAGHDRLAARSTRGESIVVPGAGHNIQLEQPQAVIDAIRKVVMELRDAKAK